MVFVLAPYELSALGLKNRLVMAPMTRARAADDGMPTALMAEYYAQRASAGLIVTEGVYPETGMPGPTSSCGAVLRPGHRFRRSDAGVGAADAGRGHGRPVRFRPAPTDPNPMTFCGGGAKGYTDYPAMQASA